MCSKRERLVVTIEADQCPLHAGRASQDPVGLVPTGAVQGQATIPSAGGRQIGLRFEQPGTSLPATPQFNAKPLWSSP
jgi:hypothetical protein